jgi:hypothetical protein
VARTRPDKARYDAVDAVTASWRQGDVALGRSVIAVVADLGAPLTPETAEVPEDVPDDVTAVPIDVDEGIVVLTQTCDIIRECSARPYIHIAPVQRVTTEEADRVAKGYHPQFVRVPAVDRLVADLDRITTIEKSVLLRCSRTEGCATDDQRRAFGRFLARKDSRFAFPDDFSHSIERLRTRIREKHDRASPEGAALRDHLREIRVTAAWDDEQVIPFLTFVRHDNADAERVEWHRFLDQWLKLCQPHGRIVDVDGTMATLREMTAQEYVDSDPLDLDFLSFRRASAR